MRRGLLWLLTLLVAAAAFAVALARGRASTHGTVRAAPVFSLPDVAGRMTRFTPVPGGAVLRFGSVSCTICDADWRLLAAWSASFHVRIVAVEVGEPLSLVQMALTGQRLPVPVLVDPSGAVAASYGVTSLPSFAFIDGAGQLRAVESVDTRTGLWSRATFAHYVALLRPAGRSAG